MKRTILLLAMILLLGVSLTACKTKQDDVSSEDVKKRTQPRKQTRLRTQKHPRIPMQREKSGTKQKLRIQARRRTQQRTIVRIRKWTMVSGNRTGRQLI